jgi:hypothetical protein
VSRGVSYVGGAWRWRRSWSFAECFDTAGGCYGESSDMRGDCLSGVARAEDRSRVLPPGLRIPLITRLVGIVVWVTEFE